MRTRRSLLRTVGGVTVVGLAGCSGGDSTDGATPTDGPASADDSTPTEGSDPVETTEEAAGDAGSPGTWGSLDADAGNTSSNPDASGPERSPSLGTVYEQTTVENILTAPVVAGETVAFVDESAIRAVSLTGDQRWQFGWGGNQSPPPTPALRDGTVYFPTRDALVAVTDGGGEWSTDLPGQPVSSPTVTADGVYLLTEGEQYTIVAYDHDGEKRFELPADEALSAPAVDGSTLYHYREREFDETQVVARGTADGGVRWTNSDFDSSSAPVAADGTVYCVRPDRYGAVVVALSSVDGTAEWVSDVVTDDIVGSPAVTSETLYVATTEGVRAFETADGSPAWEEPYSADSSITGQPRVDEHSVYMADGDTAVAVDRETGERRWSTSFGTDGDPGVLGVCPVGDRVYATLQRRVVALE